MSVIITAETADNRYDLKPRIYLIFVLAILH